MFLRRFTDFILQNRVQAMATAFVIAFIPIIGSIGILIAALITLRKGPFEGTFVAVAATVPYVISYFASSPAPDQTQLAMVLLGVVIVSNLLTWIFAVVLQRFNNWNFVIELAALLGVLVIGMVYLVNPDIQNWWSTELTSYFTKSVGVLDKLNNEVASKEVAATQAQAIVAINSMKHYATGFLVVSMLFNALLQLLIARWWQAVMFNPGELRKELYQIRLGYVASLVLVIVLVLAYLEVDFAMDVLPVLLMAFFVAGLSLLHKLISLTKMSWLWLVVMYLGIIWLVPLSIVIVAMIALLDTGLNFRKRFLL